MNKSLTTNLLALLIILAGYVSPVFGEYLLSVGFFAFSGAVTNWLAVHMLFEKVPLLYGSGVIQLQFEEFKTGIRSLIMNQFFSDENVDRFFQDKQNSPIAGINFENVVDALDFDLIFDNLVDLIQKSSIGGMLSMIGGTKILEPMKAPFQQKFRSLILDFSKSNKFLDILEQNLLPSHMSSDVIRKIEHIVDQRLSELTPQMVKTIVQDMIARHLGWLVVWGGVFGGAIGLVMSFFQ